MPRSPSMNVIRLLHDAVLVKAGSYPIRPKSSSDTLICRRSAGRMAPFSIGISYCLAVRLSTIVSVSFGMAISGAGMVISSAHPLAEQPGSLHDRADARRKARRRSRRRFCGLPTGETDARDLSHLRQRDVALLHQGPFVLSLQGPAA